MKKIILLTAVAFAFCSMGFAQNKTSLKLKEGQKYVIENKINSQTTTEVQGQAMENLSDIQSTYSIVVKEVGGDSIDLTNTVTGMKMTMTQMGQEMTFDSDKPEDLDGPIGSSLKGLINNPKDVTISKSGEIAVTKEDSADEATNMIAKQLGDFDASGYGATMAFMTLPENLNEGTTWTDKSEKEGTSRSTTYTVKSLSGDLATLSVSGTSSTEMKMEQQGMEMTVKGTGKVTGEQVVNTKTGVIQSNTSTVDSEGTVEAMGQEFPTNTKLTSTTTVKLQ